MLTPLTERQRKVLDLIAATVQRTGICPTLQEIGDAIHRSKATVFGQISELRAKGWLEGGCGPGAGRGASRCFTLTPEANAALGRLDRIATLEQECRVLAKLAAKTPQFFNPLHVYEAEQIRDRWLATPAGEAVGS